ncbi:metal ABC transporter solute-binding protein, Zn/Mn family [Gordonia polyisoprenivorans]|uniref:metal ABC transporter solute-binding protein, Zn/Mn family n=1 Tax=Gordonia polyisoprenivorans TaxID=84595 RepID=UPI002301E394|nr:zinc ABC transporter substrate-binding protein [Gordonia polyisoprenivorans]WCB36962.1 zinc ABC transporter substrate-binding protein [Gordonia polyisoprenivorans]
MRISRMAVAAVAAAAVVIGIAGCSSSSSGTEDSTIHAVAAENEYADVLSQVGGHYVSVSAIMSDPNTDPHTYEASPSVAKELRDATLVVQNGLGYDDFMSKLEQASPVNGRKVVVAQQVLGLPDSTPNPHLWYDPKTMPAVAKAIADDLGTLRPAHKDEFEKNAAAFTASLQPWLTALASFAKTHPATPVAVTEPVADYLLQAAGTDIKTPWTLQAAIMNDTDPSPQDSTLQDSLLNGKQVKVFLYNQQVTDDTTSKYLALSKSHGIPVVGVYETMPTGYTYQRWMTAELDAMSKAVTDGTSTEKL